MAKDPDAVGGERIKILDFGIAKVVDPASQTHNGPPTWAPTIQPTAVGTVLGTPAYMPPEQWYGSSQADARSDVYSCGAIFYEMMSGRPPFTAAFIGELMEQHFYQEPASLKQVAPWTPDEFIRLVQDMMSKLPASRPTMAQVVSRLQDLLREHRNRRGSGIRQAEDDPDGTIPSRKMEPSSLWMQLQGQLRMMKRSWPQRLLLLLKQISALWWLRWGMLGACSMVVIGLLWWVLRAPNPQDVPILKDMQPAPMIAVSSTPSSKLYLYASVEQSFDGLLHPYCETPCHVPLDRLTKETSVILVNDSYRSVTLNKQEMARAVSEQSISVELPQKVILAPQKKQCGPGKGRCQTR